MNMNLREWLIVFGVVIIAGIVLDGIRRMRRARKDSLEVSIGMGGESENSPLDEGFNPELPNGGARIVSRSSNTDVVNDDGIEPVEGSHEGVVRREPSLGACEIAGDAFNEDDVSTVRIVAREPEDSLPIDQGDSIAPQPDEVRSGRASVEKTGRLSNQSSKKITFGEGLKATGAAVKKSASSTKTEKKTSEKGAEPAQEVIVLNVLSKSAEGFKGPELKKLLEVCGMEHGAMSIFHRHESTVDSPVQFSVANAVEPGVFPKELMDTLTTPGICFFMSLPGPENNMRAFDYMVETAQCVVRNLAGEMKDERRSDMTPQTLEHCRQRIKDFERRQLTARC